MKLLQAFDAYSQFSAPPRTLVLGGNRIPLYFLALVLCLPLLTPSYAFAQNSGLTDSTDHLQVKDLATLTAAEKLLRSNQPHRAADRISSLSLEGHHGPAILQIRAWALYHSGGYGELALLLEAQHHLKSEYKYLRGAARLRTGRWETGKQDLQSLWWEQSQTIWGLAALRELALSNLPGTYSFKERALIRKLIPDITYQSKQKTARLHHRRLKALRRRVPKKGLLARELLFANGVRLLDEENFSQAVIAFRKALQTTTVSSFSRVIELNLAKALRFKGVYKSALKHFDHVAETGTDELRYEALSQAAHMAILYRKYSDAKARYQALLISNPIGPAREQALWGLGWVSFRNRDYNQALPFFQTLLTEQPFGPNAPGALYWAARCRQELKQVEDAYAHFRALIDRFPVDYYAHRASEILAKNKDATRPKLLAALPKKSTAPKVARIEDLVRSGLTAKARQAFAELIPNALDYLSPAELDILYNAAKKAGLQKFAGNMRGVRNRRFPRPTASGLRTLAANFPMNYVRILRPAAKANRLEPNLVVALAKQESAFNPKAISSAGALGLLQLMPKTALTLIREYKPKANPTSAEIMSPRLNAKLGTRYLGRMLRSFKGEVEYALAAYNAGPGAVTRWRQRSGYRPAEIFVEEIPYKETRLYVRKVLSWKRKFEFLLANRDKLPYAKKKKSAKRSPTRKKKRTISASY